MTTGRDFFSNHWANKVPVCWNALTFSHVGNRKWRIRWISCFLGRNAGDGCHLITRVFSFCDLNVIVFGYSYKRVRLKNNCLTFNLTLKAVKILYSS